MSNEFVIKNGFHSHGNSEITGSLTVTGGITGSLEGTSTSASYAATASYAGLYSGNGTIPLNTTASVNGDLLFQGLDEDTKLIVKDGNGGSSIELFSDGNAGQASIRFIDPADQLIHQISQAGGDTRYISNNRDLVFSTSTASNSAGIFIQSGSGNVGIGTTTPTDRLFVSGSTGEFRARVDRVLPYTTELYAKTTNPSGSSVIQLVNDSSKSIVMGVLGSNRDASVAYGGESDDAFMFASSNANNLHIFNGAGTGTEDSINFYAGNNATATPHLHIQGSGSTKGYVGIGTETPADILEVTDGTATFATNLDNGSGPLISITTTDTNTLTSFAATDGVSSINIGTVGTGWTGIQSFGVPGDNYIYSSADANGLNIISQPGTGTEDYIRLYAGGNPTTATASIHIQGDGSTTGFVGIGTETPSEILDVVQNTERFRLNLDFVDGPQAALGTTRTDIVSRFAASDGVVSTTMNTIGFDWTGSTVYGNPGDSSIYSNTSANGISIISAPGTGTEDYIRFYAGGNPQTSAASMHIQGDGSTIGNVGIGTETPNAKLDVAGNVIITGSLSVTGGITGSLLGTASFADNVLFEPGQLGTNSTVRIDSFNTASGNYSFAVGTGNNASGISGMALGSGNTASGDRAVALGRDNIASGSRSYASGYLNISSHNQTFTHGYLNTASQQYAVAVGRENTSAGIGSIALGYLNYLATGSYSFAAGYDNNIVPSYAGAIGYRNTILSTYGMAFGALNQAGNYAVAAGVNNDATAIYSVALGSGNLASAQSSIALGQSNTSSGLASIALGYLVTASADHSIAIGRQSSANALYSSAVGGRLNNADAIYSGIFAGFNNNVPAAGYSGSVIIGGDSNVNSGSYSAIVGGRNNTIGPAVNSVILGGTNINAADTSNTVFVPNFYATGSVQAPNIANTETTQTVYYNTSSGVFTYGDNPIPTVVPDATKVFSWFMNAT
jgi:hypothetical protein